MQIKTFLSIALMFLLWVSTAMAEIYTVSTLAGSGEQGYADGNGTGASFRHPSGITADDSGNLYVVDFGNWFVRKVTPEGVVTTAVGIGGPFSGEISSLNKRVIMVILYNPQGITMDDIGNLYVTEEGKITKISPDGAVNSVAGSNSTGADDGTGSEAGFYAPHDVAVDDSGNLYIADAMNHKIRKITPDGVVTTIAGTGEEGSVDGNGSTAAFNFPSGIVIDDDDNLYVIDSWNNKIRKITPDGVVTTIAGTGEEGSRDGNGSTATFNRPARIVMDDHDNLYVTDAWNNKIRKITPDGVVTTIVGSGFEGSVDGTGTMASFHRPLGITMDRSGNLYVTDGLNHKIRKITVSQTVTKTLKTGWNLIGNPKNESFETSNISDKTVVWSYDGGWQKNPATIAPCHGFWVKAASEGNVTFDSSDCTVDANTLSDGWNLLSTGSPLYAPEDKLEAVSVWSYEGAAWAHHPMSIESGSGFWVKQ